jgi:ribosome-binding factor A
MSQRTVRVNELLQREISLVLHTRFRSETVGITILRVDVAPNLRSAIVWYGTHGDEALRPAAHRFFTRNHEEIRRKAGELIRLKFLPHLDFKYDAGADYSAHINQLLDDLGMIGEGAAPLTLDEASPDPDDEPHPFDRQPQPDELDEDESSDEEDAPNA